MHSTRLHALILLGFLVLSTIGCKKDAEDILAIDPFFSFVVPADFEEYGTVREYWIFVSNELGETLGAKKFLKGDVLEFNKPVNHTADKLYSFSIVKLYLGPSFGPGIARTYYNSITTYSKVKAGEYTLRKEGSENPPQSIIGTSSLIINNLPSANPFVVSTGGMGIKYASNDGLIVPPTPYPIGIIKNNADVFHLTLDVKNNVPKYAFFKNVQVAQIETLSYQDMKTPVQISFPLLNDSYVGAKLEAVSQVGDYDNRFMVYNDPFSFTNFFLKSTKLYYPVEMNYPEYITSIRRGGFDHDQTYRLISSKPASIEKNLNGDIISLSNSANHLTIKTTGKYDACGAFAGEIINITPAEEGAFSWILYVGSSNDNFEMLPKIPEDIINSGFLSLLKNYQFKFASASLIEYTEMNGYDEFIEATFRYSGNFDTKFKETITKTRHF